MLRFAALALLVGGCAEGVRDEPFSAGSSSAREEATTPGATENTAFSDGPEVGAQCPAIAVDRQNLSARTQEFSIRHGIDTSVAFDGCPTEESVRCEAVTSREYASIVTFLDQVEGDLEIYPPDFFRAIHLDVIVFGSHLTTTKDEPHALGGAVIPRGDHRSVLYLSTRQARFCDASLNRRTFHHEIAHALDMGMTGVSETGWWATLNPAGFTYGDVDPSATDLLDIDHPGAGLVSRYARASVSEDHAEVYTAMFMAKDSAQLRGWLREDRWLAAKFQNAMRPLEATWPSFVKSMPNHDALD